MPRLPGIQSAPTQLGRRATPEDFGSQLGAVEAQSAAPITELGEISQRIAAARESAQVSRLSEEYGIGAEDDFRTIADSGAPPEELEGLLQESLRKRRAALAEQVGGFGRDRFEERAALQDQRTLMQARDYVRDEQIRLAKGDTQASISMAAQRAARGDPEARNRILEAVGRSVGGGVFTQAQGQELIQAADAQIAEAAWRAGLNEDPEGTLDEIRASRGPFQRMDEADRQQAIRQLETQARQNERFDKAREAEARAEAQRVQQETEAETRKTLLLEAARGQLTVDRIEELAPNLSASAVSELLTDVRQARPDVRTGTPDPNEYFRLRDLQTKSPAQFLDAEIDPMRVGLENAAKLIEAQQKIRQGVGETPTGLQSRLSRWTDGFKADEDEKSILYGAGERAVLAFQEREGRAASDQEQQQILDGVLLEQLRVRRGFFYDSTEVIPPGKSIDPAALPPIPGVPDEDARQIVEALTAKRRRVTIDNIRKAYAKQVAAQ